MANQIIGGTCYITVDGQELSVEGSLSIPVNTVSKEAVIASGRVIGYTKKTIAPSLKGTFYVDNQFPLQKIIEASDMTILAEFANGWKYTLSNAFLSGDSIEFTPEDGKITLTFTGLKGDWS